jgi:flagellar biosynthetic protein FliP
MCNDESVSWQSTGCCVGDLATFAAILGVSDLAMAQVTLPSVNLGFKTTQNPSEVVNTVKIILMMTVLTLAPAILIMMTGFTRLIVVFSFLATGTWHGANAAESDPCWTCALFLTFFIMRPAFEEVNQNALAALSWQ